MLLVRGGPARRDGRALAPAFYVILLVGGLSAQKPAASSRPINDIVTA